MSGSGGSRVVAPVGAAVSAALASPLGAVDPLVELGALAVARNQLAALESRLVAEVESRRRDGVYGGTRTTAELLAHVAPVTHREATARVATACALAPVRSLTGEPLPAVAPAVAAACREGRVSGEQAAVIVAAVEQARDKADVTVGEIVETTLVDACAVEHVPGLRRMASRLLAVLDQDGDEPVEAASASRAFRTRRWRDGLTRFTLDLPALDAALVTTVVDSLAAPTPAEDGELDTRSAPQRRADAVVEVFARVTRSGTLPTTAGAPVTVLVTTTRDDLLAASSRTGTGSRTDAGSRSRPDVEVTARGVAVTEHGEPIPMPDLLAASRGDTALLPVVLDTHGAVLHLGRAQRCASVDQRRALAARDRGCSFPGCDRPPAWTQAHHVTEWHTGGPTDLDNLTLVCGAHHRSFGPAGWHVTIHHGIPEWTPPPWIDPHQRPRRNHSHHLSDAAFRAALAARDGAGTTAVTGPVRE